MAIGQFRSRTRFIQHTTVAFMNGMLRAYQILADNMQMNGLAPHYARVDSAFVNEPENLGAVVQWTDLAPATTNAEVWAGANALRLLMLAHFADAVFAHRAADTTDGALIAVLTVPNATDSTTASTLLAAMKSALNAHVVNGDYHASVPPSMLAVTVTGTPADASSNLTTYNEMLAIYKRHVFSAVERIDWEPV